jgi:hypothetical protein
MDMDSGRENAELKEECGKTKLPTWHAVNIMFNDNIPLLKFRFMICLSLLF